MKYLTGIFFTLQLLAIDCMAQTAEPHRPLLHFSPAAHWMNDPNGMYYNNGVYHLFFQYYPKDTRWGPMHWGHATSKDMINWTEQAIALYPDSLGYIFSGSVVIDKNNSSGLGKNNKVPVIAIFTHHDPKGEEQKRNDYQNQSIAYSLDDGMTWTKYAGNPVLKNPGITDFRDPKVMWYEAGKKWIMSLATKDRISFYSSADLLHWTKESEFGEQLGAHGGVWECPDLFPLSYNGTKLWVLLVSINPGGPNLGSATQYFIGEFDGKKFTTTDTVTKWMDYGPDNYAGVTFSNVQQRTVLIGWMSNWLYGQDVPTKTWRSAMTLPRELSIQKVKDHFYLASVPAKETGLLNSSTLQWKNVAVKNSYAIKAPEKSTYRLDLSAPVADFSIVLGNEKGEELVIGYEKGANRYYIDRTRSGASGFGTDFSKKEFASRISIAAGLDLTLIVDVASVELFADGGLTAMTAIFFPATPLSKIQLRSVNGITVRSIKYTPLKPAVLMGVK